MKNAKILLAENSRLIADGAMGTFFLELSGTSLSTCESANLEQPELIRQIHQAYLDAGAQLLRTNTFAAINPADAPEFKSLPDVIHAGYRLARDVAGDKALVAADIGPAYGLEPDVAWHAYEKVIDAFCAEQADLFILETFADPDEAIALSKSIRRKVPDALIIASFALSADGLTRKGMGIRALAEKIDNCPTIDLFGLNCGIGPTHLRQILTQLPLMHKPLSLMPNSGYPRRDQERTIFSASPVIFAQATGELISENVHLIGGCCGTTPDHIRALRDQLAGQTGLDHPATPAVKTANLPFVRPNNADFRLADKIKSDQFVTICELDPPRHSDLHDLLAAARVLAAARIDAITLADSPLARVKVDPVIAAARIQREVHIPVMPHLTCRDRNINALRSLLLGAHAEGIRQILAITGDGIAEAERGFIKPVFNINSIGLVEQISLMNSDVFVNEPMLTGVALDLNVANPAAELKRLQKKQAAGASFVLTQPLFAAVDAKVLLTPVREAGLKVLLGLMPLVSYRNARYLFAEVPGIRIPEALLDRFDPEMSKDAASEQGLRICLEVARQMRPFIDGFYLIAPFNRADLIAELVRRLKLEKLL